MVIDIDSKYSEFVKEKIRIGIESADKETRFSSDEVKKRFKVKANRRNLNK